MTDVERKAKAYDEALEKAKEFKNNPFAGYDGTDLISALFPELAESEDKKWIPKEIVKYLKEKGDFRSCWIAWLEKQGEKKPTTNKYNVGATIYYSSFGEIKSMVVANVVDIGDGNPMYEDAYGNAVFEKALILQMNAENQKPVEPKWCHHKVDLSDCSEEYCKAYYDGWNNCNQQHEQLKAEQKPVEWSEEDEKMCNNLILTLTKIGATSRTDSTSVNYTFPKEIDWLKSLKDKCLPQPKQEWIEKDKKVIEEVACILLNDVNRADSKNEEEKLTRLAEKIQSLKIFEHWNTSEEQKPVVPKFKVGDRIIEKDFEECGCGTIKEIKDGKYIFDDRGFSFINIEEQNLWQLVEQKPVEQDVQSVEWSEEDEKRMLRITTFLWKNRRGDTSEICRQEQDINWLNSIKYRVLPQPKQEWSKEDEAMRNFIIRIMEVEHPNGLFEVGGFYNSFKRNSIPVSMIISWLKSLRPQNTWKPTQMQISALEWQIASTYQGSWQYKATEELLKQLKAL